jgi:hypothetical protein
MSQEAATPISASSVSREAVKGDDRMSRHGQFPFMKNCMMALMAEKTRGNVPCKVVGPQAVEAEFPIFDFCNLGVGVEVDKDGASP